MLSSCFFFLLYREPVVCSDLAEFVRKEDYDSFVEASIHRTPVNQVSQTLSKTEHLVSESLILTLAASCVECQWKLRENRTT